MAIATDGLYRLTHGWQHPGTEYFAGDVGKDVYNLNNAELAKTLLKEAGYKGEPFTLVTDNSFKNDNDASVVASQQLQAVGINVKLQVADWPTSIAMRQKPTGWNMFPIFIGIEPWEGPVQHDDLLHRQGELAAAHGRRARGRRGEAQFRAGARRPQGRFRGVPAARHRPGLRHQARRSRHLPGRPGERRQLQAVPHSAHVGRLVQVAGRSRARTDAEHLHAGVWRAPCRCSLLVSLISFVLIWLVPGDAAAEMAGPSASAEELARIRADLGLDQPIWIQARIGTGTCCPAISASRCCSPQRRRRRSWSGCRSPCR